MNNNGTCNNINVIVFERLWFKNYFRNVCLFVCFFLKNSFSKMNRFNKKEQSQKCVFSDLFKVSFSGRWMARTNN